MKVESTKLFKHNAYGVTLTLPLWFREQYRLDHDKVIEQLLNSVCTAPEDKGMGQMLRCTHCCAGDGSGVVSLHAASQLPSVGLGEEVYRITLKPVCSSSRNHLRSSVCLVVQLADQFVKSDPFVLQARKFQSHNKSMADEDEDEKRVSPKANRKAKKTSPKEDLESSPLLDLSPADLPPIKITRKQSKRSNDSDSTDEDYSDSNKSGFATSKRSREEKISNGKKLRQSCTKVTCDAEVQTDEFDILQLIFPDSPTAMAAAAAAMNSHYTAAFSPEALFQHIQMQLQLQIQKQQELVESSSISSLRQTCPSSMQMYSQPQPQRSPPPMFVGFSGEQSTTASAHLQPVHNIVQPPFMLVSPTVTMAESQTPAVGVDGLAGITGIPNANNSTAPEALLSPTISNMNIGGSVNSVSTPAVSMPPSNNNGNNNANNYSDNLWEGVTVSIGDDEASVFFDYLPKTTEQQ